MSSMTYKRAGVDIDKADAFVKKITFGEILVQDIFCLLTDGLFDKKIEIAAILNKMQDQFKKLYKNERQRKCYNGEHCFF